MSHFANLLKLRGDFDLYHLTDGALAVIARLRRPVVVTVHDIIPFLNQRPISSALLDLMLRLSMSGLHYADRIIVDSSHARDELSRVLHINASELRLVPLGVDHSIFKPFNREESRKRLALPLDSNIILNVGSEETRKNIPVLIRAFGALQKRLPKSILIRIGTQESKEAMKLISTNNIQDKIMYLHPRRDQMPFVYSAADVLVFPSYYEGFGLPPLEAMACGCPVVVSKASSMPEIVGNAGILVEPTDYVAFCEWTEKVVSSRGLRADLSNRGLEQSQKFSWEITAKKTFDVYMEVLSDRERLSREN